MELKLHNNLKIGLMRTEYIYKIEVETSATNSFTFDILAKDFKDASTKANKVLQDEVEYLRLKSVIETKEINIVD